MTVRQSVVESAPVFRRAERHSLTRMSEAVSIHLMFKWTARPIDVSILWFLTGLLAFGCVINVMPAVQLSKEFAEERLLELELEEEDGVDSDELGFVVDTGILASSLSWQLVPFRFAPQPDRFKYSSHFVRGPPSC